MRDSASKRTNHEVFGGGTSSRFAPLGTSCHPVVIAFVFAIVTAPVILILMVSIISVVAIDILIVIFLLAFVLVFVSAVHSGTTMETTIIIQAVLLMY